VGYWKAAFKALPHGGFELPVVRRMRCKDFLEDNRYGRAILDETGHWEVADDTIGRPPLFLIAFSFFYVGETSPGNKKPNE
jgi:hypothetical protein